MKRRIFFCLVIPVVFALSCGDSDSSKNAPYTGPVEFTPLIATATAPGSDVEVEVPSGLLMDVFIDGLSRKVVIGMLNLYFFLGSPDNSKDLSCSSPETFTYGAGQILYCPEENNIDVKTLDGAYQPLRSNELKMASCHLPNWPTEAPPAIMGLSGNLTAKNRTGMTSVIEQLNPSYLSFSFPKGMTKSGFLQFDKLPEDAAAAFPQIPLVDPGVLEFGYTASPLRIEFYHKGKAHTILRNTEEGLLLETESSIDRVADEFRVGFDTGTTLPIEVFEATPLLSSQVPRKALNPESSASHYDRVLVVFEGESGEEILVDSGDLRLWIGNSPFDRVPTKASIPDNTQQVVILMGINFIGRFDFQFDFDGGRATHITFVER